MRTLFITLALVGFGCGDDGGTTPAIDAAPPPVDATPPLALDCNTYCTQIATACTGATAQFGAGTASNCMGTCAAFPLGTQADTSGNTLGCRNYHIQNITVRGGAVATHCPHTGPTGGPIAATAPTCGSPCEDFCAMEAKVCGTDAAPVTGVANRYADANACMTACNAFTKTPEYSPTVPNGNTFACRFYHLTNAAQQVPGSTGHNTHCGHTLSPAVGVCI